MAKDESRVQSLLSAFSRKRVQKEPKPEVKPNDTETQKSAYTPAMRTAVAGGLGVVLDLARTSLANMDDKNQKLALSEQLFSALTTGAKAAGTVGVFTHTDGKPMAARLALTGAAFFAAGAPISALRAATGKDLAGAGKQNQNSAHAMAKLTGSQGGFGRAVRRPFL